MIVVGLDPSLTSTGIAVLRDGIPVMLHSLGHKGTDADSYQVRGRRIVSQARAVMAALENSPGAGGMVIDLALIEGPSLGSQWGDQWDRAALWWGIYSALAAKKVPIAVVAPKTRAKWATGSGNSDKKAVLAAVRETWQQWRPHIRNDDVGDALVLASMGALYIGDTLPFEPRRSQHEGLKSVHWPEGIGHARL